MHQNAFTQYAQTILGVIEHVGLAIITIATVIAGYLEVSHMIGLGTVTLADLLMLFLYLEILAMVGMYYGSGKLPVRFPIYIAIVALSRFLVLDIKNLDVWHMLSVSAAILLLTVAVLALRYGHKQFPYGERE